MVKNNGESCETGRKSVNIGFNFPKSVKNRLHIETSIQSFISRYEIKFIYFIDLFIFFLFLILFIS